MSVRVYALMETPVIVGFPFWFRFLSHDYDKASKNLPKSNARVSWLGMEIPV